MSQPTLKRSIGLPLLTMYGIGTILGAGIYVLIGEVAGAAGMAAPSAFLLACVVAGLTALSYAELASRLPKSAGEAAYVEAAFRKPALSKLTGWAVIATGIVSAATMSRGIVGYLGVFIDVPAPLVLVVIVGTLTVIAVWGVSQSLWAAAIVTVLEVLGLAFVCVVAGDSLTQLPTQWRGFVPSWESASLTGLLAGAFLAFYAFIGFEDIVNVAEEVKSPRRTLPFAIILSLTFAAIAYFVVAAVAVLTLSPAALAATAAPLASIVASRGVAPESIAAISVLAVLNGALIQLIMASRVLYGMAAQQLAWSRFARVNARTRTPIVATLAAGATILGLATFFSLGGLARFTSALALLVFAAINAALWRLKTTAAPSPFRVPKLVPLLGFVCCAAMLAHWALGLAGLLPRTG
jgi:amino acid transporter